MVQSSVNGVATNKRDVSTNFDHHEHNYCCLFWMLEFLWQSNTVSPKYLIGATTNLIIPNFEFTTQEYAAGIAKSVQ
jgi:hypothetical protein